MLRHIAALAAVFIAGSAQAETWEGAWKIATGRCADGIGVRVEEAAGVVKVMSLGGTNVGATGNTMVSAERVIPLSGDGSGKMNYTSTTMGQVELSIASGTGRRQLKMKQVRDICQWEVK